MTTVESGTEFSSGMDDERPPRQPTPQPARPQAPQPQPARPQPPEQPEIADLRARVGELEDLWRRSAADLDNLRKRFGSQTRQLREDERARVTAEWLPVLDNIELALAHAGGDPTAIVEGVRGVRDQAVEVLSRLGYQRRDDNGEPFDPQRHEAVAVLPADGADAGTVVRVVRPGYGNDERLLRPAAVVVAQG